LNLVLGFKLPGFGGHQPEHGDAIVGPRGGYWMPRFQPKSALADFGSY